MCRLIYKSRNLAVCLDARAGPRHGEIKGLWLLRQIHARQGDWQDNESPNFAISNQEWYRFIQNHEHRNSKV